MKQTKHVHHTVQVSHSSIWSLFFQYSSVTAKNVILGLHGTGQRQAAHNLVRRKNKHLKSVEHICTQPLYSDTPIKSANSININGAVLGKTLKVFLENLSEQTAS